MLLRCLRLAWRGFWYYYNCDQFHREKWKRWACMEDACEGREEITACRRLKEHFGDHDSPRYRQWLQAAKVEPVTKIPRYHVTQTWSCGCGATSETDPRTFVDHTRLGHRAPPAERAKSDAAKGKTDER